MEAEQHLDHNQLRQAAQADLAASADGRLDSLPQTHINAWFCSSLRAHPQLVGVAVAAVAVPTLPGGQEAT